jgi:serine/threonine protein kinase
MMGSERWQHIGTVFAAARERTDDERAAFLDGACAGDPGMRREIESLLAYDDKARDFMEVHALDLVGSEAQGALIGPYRLLEQIGEGGFGVVFLAEQLEPVHRTVALKVLKPGLYTREVAARFEAERQALALLDHPNIAKIFDGGATASGRPWFVMELFRGVPITQFCDQHRLSPKQRLELFVIICQAVQHAHQKGIIHRDLKPSNVLVMMDGAAPAAKVIDFGVAKALGHKLTDKTLDTGCAQIVGTPLYMSPEQAGAGALDIDTRSDVYSLGVLLYELLTGSTPFDSKRLRQTPLDEIRRIIREEEPPKPSTKLLESKESLVSISAQRRTEPGKLTKLVRGELDWIVMKCLEKDRNRRYGTASALSEDVRHYLNEEPVLACPPSASYRFRKFARRHKTALLAAGLVTASLLVGTTVATWQAVRATRARTAALAEKQRADEEAAAATSATNSLQQILSLIQPTAAKGLDYYKVRLLLDGYESDLEKQLPVRPEAEATVQHAIGRAFASVGEPAKAREHLARALKLRRGIFGDQHEKYADYLVDYATPDTSDLARRPDPAQEADLRRALAIYRARGVGGRPVIHALYVLQWLLTEEANKDAPAKWHEVEIAEEEGLAETVKSPGVEFPETVNFLRGLAEARINQSQSAEGEKIARESLALSLRLLPSGHYDIGWAYYVLAIALRDQRKFKEALQADQQAVAILQKALPPGRGVALALAAVIRTLSAAADSQSLPQVLPSLTEAAQLQSVFLDVLKTTKPTTMDYADPAAVAALGLARFSDFYRRLSDELASSGRMQEAEKWRQKAAGAAAILRTQLAGNVGLLSYIDRSRRGF